MLADTLRADLTAAMKARDEVRLGALRLALASMQEAAVSGDAAHVLDDDEVLAVLGREVKRKDEAIEAFEGAGRTEQAARERAEREVLAAYLPAGLSDDEVGEIVDGVLADHGFSSPSDMGAAMKAVMAQVGGRADGRTVSGIVKSRLSS
jgi:uncharacterized protein